MGNKQSSEKKQENDQDKTTFEWLFSNRKWDQDYVPDLKSQWAQMDNADRVKFVLGGIIGLLLFVGALALAYYLLTLMIR